MRISLFYIIEPPILTNNILKKAQIAHRKSARLACAVPAASFEQAFHLAEGVEILPAISAKASLRVVNLMGSDLMAWRATSRTTHTPRGAQYFSEISRTASTDACLPICARRSRTARRAA